MMLRSIINRWVAVISVILSGWSDTDIERYDGFSKKVATSLRLDIRRDPVAVFALKTPIGASQKVTIEMKFRVEQLSLGNHQMTNQEMAKMSCSQ
jgi:hypothetical protein